MQILSVLALVLAAVTAEVYFEEDFSGDWESRWQAGTPPGKEMGKFAVTSGKWFVDEEAEKQIRKRSLRSLNALLTLVGYVQPELKSRIATVK